VISPAPSNDHGRVLDLTPGSTPNADGRRLCKFILVEYKDAVHLVFGDISTHKYHANLLHEFCERFNIESEWVHEPDLLEPLDSSIDVLGGGLVELHGASKTVSFSSASKAYGQYHRHHLEAVLAASREFAELTIRISS